MIDAPEKVLFVINSLAGGGAERIMSRLLAYSGDRGHELHLALLDEDPEAYTVPDHVTVHRFDTKGSMIAGFMPLLRLIRTLRPAAVLSFLTRSNVLAVLACRLTRTRCVISERVHTTSHHPDNRSGKLAKWLTALVYPMSDAVIAVSDGIADDLADNYRTPRSRIAVIPNPVDGDDVRRKGSEPLDPVPGRPLLVAMGRLVPNKNFAMLIEAFSRTTGLGTLVILGDGPLRGDLERQVEALGLQGRVLLPGFQANPFSLIAKADCYVLPSNGEGFPNGLIEAMVLGVPVVSTNCHSGPAEILDDRPFFEVTGATECKYGLLVPTDDAGAMAEAMQTACAPGQYDVRARRAAQGAARYDLTSTIDRYWSVILPRP